MRPPIDPKSDLPENQTEAMARFKKDDTAQQAFAHTLRLSEVNADDFKGALGSWAAGVTVVSTRLGDQVYGITVSSFSSLSVDPLLILVSIQNSNHLAAMIPKSKVFAVSILASDQESVSGAFSVSGREPGATLGPGVPVVEGDRPVSVAAATRCRVTCNADSHE